MRRPAPRGGVGPVPTSNAAGRLLLFVLLLAALGLGAWREVHWPRRRAGAPAQALVVPPGAGVGDIARNLHGLGLVRHPLEFQLLVVARGVAGRLRAGEYALEGTMSLQDIVDKLLRGDVVRTEITFPEGKNAEEMAALAAERGIAATAYLAAARDATPIRDLDAKAEDLEGYLFPDTYDLPRGPEAAAVLVGGQIKRFRAVIDPEMAAVRASPRTLREIVTLAALVELETAKPEERPRVAAVFLNRLARGMPLQTDPTVIYALRKAGTYDGNIRKGDLEIDSPYNTYRYAGLPPGPIATPGRASLLAVLHPAPVKDLYFVSRNDGSHHFSETLAEHQKAVNYYQRRRGAPPVEKPRG